ncbi:RNA-directed DNA polymerase, eukaryota [Tanacetum coccineum]
MLSVNNREIVAFTFTNRRILPDSRLKYHGSLWYRVIQALYGDIISSHSIQVSSNWSSILRELQVLRDKGFDFWSHCKKRIGNGCDTRFWFDCWIGESPLHIQFPRLFALEQDKDISVAIKLNFSLDHSFRRCVRDGIEFQQMTELKSKLDLISLSNSRDLWFCDLTGDGEFRVKEVRNFIDDLFLPSFDSTRWVKCIPIKINVFVWRARRDCLPTRVNLARRGVNIESNTCPICRSCEEDTQHILFQCDLAQIVLQRICRWWDLTPHTWTSFVEWQSWFSSVRLTSKVKNLLEGVFYVAWWAIWSFRNRIIFQETHPRRSVIFDDIVLHAFNWCSSRINHIFMSLILDGVTLHDACLIIIRSWKPSSDLCNNKCTGKWKITSNDTIARHGKEEEAIREDLNSMSDKGGSVNMGRKDHRITRSGDGESMNFLSLNIQGLAQKAKKDWVRELAMKHKVNFLSIQETKIEEIDLFSICNCWGNYSYDFLYSNSVGNSGWILCVWDPNSFIKHNYTISDYFVIVRGKWLKKDIDLLIVAIYAPHDPRDKTMVWDYLSHVINQWKGSVVIMGDFNEVRFKSDRFGSIFNEKGADEFNSFIANSGLEEVPLGGCNFTWCHKSAAKMSKLDRFLVSNNLFTYCPHISAITLDRFLSDHRPILLRETSFDYGPVPFRFFQHWIEIDGFSKFIEDTWNLAPVSGTNALCVLISKMKFLKNRIREWINVSRVKTNGDIQCFKEELRVFDEVIDKGEGSDTILTKRLELINDIKRIEQLKAKEMAQKSKIKGILVNGDWIDHPLEVKREFFNHFRDRFANSKDTRITIDMTFPKQISNDQKEDLERALTKDELKAAVWDCGTDKSPGPDEFTFGFYRHYWSVIEHDVFDAVNYFFNSGIIPKGGNPSFITLIPKIPAANLVKDFRPICLIGSIYKIIAKILANRLVGVLDNIVHEVQSAFISGRQILDGPFILNEMLQWCKTKKKQSLIFKVDFEKAFNSVRWDFLDDVLKKFSFGLKQGDPLSPFLFILIMESLHLSFQRVVDSGMFKGLNLSNSMCISHMFYADDVVFVGKWSDENINTLTNVLECFHRASGLKINMSKSKIMGVNVDENKVNLAASKLGCLSLYNPFSYLGMKVGDMMSRAQAWKEVVDKVKNRLSKWKMKALSIGGRLTLLKSVLGSIPIFHMSIFRVPLTVLQMLESLRGHFFNGHEIGSNKATWVKWEKVLTAKDKGGLGVASLYALNRGLLVKWFWRFYNQETSLWKKVIQAIHGRDGNVHSINKSVVHSCWTTIVKEIRRLGVSGLNIFDFMKQKVGNGNIIKFWTDNWYHGGILKDIYPRLYALENRKDITVSSKLADPHLNTSFRRDIRGGCELEQFQMLVDLVDSITLAPMEDRWVWNLEGFGEFSVASALKVKGIAVAGVDRDMYAEKEETERI